MDPERIIKNQVYVDLGPDRRPLGFFIGGLHGDAQIPDDAVPISRALHQQWGGNTGGQVLSLDGKSLGIAPERTIALTERKRQARLRANAQADTKSRADTPRRDRGREERIHTATVAEARDAAGPFVAAHLAGSSTAATTAEAVAEIIAVDDAELAGESAIELVLQTALAAIEAATNQSEVGAVFPLFPS